MAKKPWRIIPRPLLETALNNHAQQHRVRLPLLFHGLRGSGKTTLILDRLLGDWNQGPHVAGYVDFAECVGEHRYRSGESFPWSSWSNTGQKPRLSDCAAKLESCLEAMLRRALRLGLVGSRDVLDAVDKWHSVSPAALAEIAGEKKKLPSSKVALWDRAVLAISSSSSSAVDPMEEGKGLSAEEAAYYREASAAVRVAKEMIGRQRGLRAGAIGEMNRHGGFSRTLANSCTDWPCLLLELLSQAAELGHFQIFFFCSAKADHKQHRGFTAGNFGRRRCVSAWGDVSRQFDMETRCLGSKLRVTIPTVLSWILDMKYSSPVRIMDGLEKKLDCIWFPITSVN